MTEIKNTKPRSANSFVKIFTFWSLLFCIIFASSTLTRAHTRADWIAAYNALNTSNYASNPDSGTLAWAQSYILFSYLNMYEATQNTAYLDSFVSQVNTMTGTMTDANNDGYSGWDTYTYSTNIVRNGSAEAVGDPSTVNYTTGFETPDGSDSTLPDGWVRWQSTSTTAYRDNANAYAGSYGCTVKTNPAGGWQVIEKTITYEPGQPYMVSFRGKISGSGARGLLSCRDFTASSDLGSIDFYNTAWQEYSFTFLAPSAAGHTLKLRLLHTVWNVSNFASCFDDVTVYKLDGRLLPKYWNRWQSSPETAYIDFDAANKTAGIAGFTIKTNPNVGWQVLESPLSNVLVNDNNNYEPGITYHVSFDAKTSSSSTGWHFEIRDFTASQILFTQDGTNTSWNSFTGSFTAPAAGGHDVRVRLYHTYWNVTGSSNFDNIKIMQDAEFAVHDGMIATAMAKFIMMVYRGQAPASYVTSANTFLGILENHLFPKWDYCLTQLDSTRGVYVAPDDGSFSDCISGGTLAHNQYLALTTAYALLARARAGGDGGAAYAGIAGKLINTFASQLRTVSDNAYEWNYWEDDLVAADSGRWPYIEDISHGNIDIAAALACYQAGIVITNADMARFANTLIHKMWNGSTSDPHLGTYVNSNSGTTLQYNTDSWIQLGAFDRQAYDIVRTMYDLNGSSVSWYYQMAVISELIKGVLVLNEPFETPDGSDSTLPLGWVRESGTTASDAYLDSTNKFEWNMGLSVKTASTWKVIRKPLTYAAGTPYQVKIMVKASGVNGEVEVRDATASTVLGVIVFSNTDWQQVVLNFTAPAAGHTVNLRLCPHTKQSTGVIYYDNLEIREIK